MRLPRRVRVTFLARPRKVTKRKPPRSRRHHLRFSGKSGSLANSLAAHNAASLEHEAHSLRFSAENARRRLRGPERQRQLQHPCGHFVPTLPGSYVHASSALAETLLRNFTASIADWAAMPYKAKSIGTCSSPPQPIPIQKPENYFHDMVFASTISNSLVVFGIPLF